ncbi:TPA: fimbrial protein [Salmonella enterica]|nr:fimbrial protein [Salmonella enterica]
MKKNILGLAIATFTAMTASPSVIAETAGPNMDVNFTANLRETTCDMKLAGGVGSDTQQTLTIGDGNGQVRLDDVKAGTAAAKFKIIIIECPASLQSLKTTVRGSAAGYLPTGLKNLIDRSTGGTDFAAVEIARATAPEAPFKINSTIDAERLIWTSTEISNSEVELVATMRETQADRMLLGSFRTVATFEFSYE